MITVLLAAWNGAAFIEEQLDSILKQSVDDIRILVSDDGSTDETREILERYQQEYPNRVRLNHRSAERREKDKRDGIPAAAGNFFWLLSCGLLMGERRFDNDEYLLPISSFGDGNGQYFMFSDQDDVWKPHKTERLLEEMKRLEAQYGTGYPILVHSDMEVVDGNLKTIHPSFFKYQKCSPERIQFSELLVENNITGGAVMINRSLAELLKERPAACLMHDWWMALAASCFGTISCVKEPLYLYRQHGNNTLGARETGSVKDVAERLNASEQVAENYRKMAAQAHAFGKMYQNRMSEEQKTVLRAYLALRYQSPTGRLKNIVKNRFFKTSMLQTLAQCVTIPRPDGGNQLR